MEMDKVIIPVWSKPSYNDGSKWYKDIPKLQRIINCTVTQSIKYHLFENITPSKLSTATFKT